MPGLVVARIGLGCGNFGGIGSAPEFFGQGLSQDQAFELMDAAWASGITHFDTADAYGGGRSERAIGRWIRSRGVRPRLTTKVFNPMEAGSDRGLEPDRIARQLRSSLDRLGVDHVDLYLAHDYDDAVPLTESLGAFRAAQADGLIGSGVSLGDFTVLIVVGLCALMAAVAAFRRADLNWRTGAPRGQRRVQSLIVYGVGWAPTASTTPLRTPGDAWRRLATISPAS